MSDADQETIMRERYKEMELEIERENVEYSKNKEKPVIIPEQQEPEYGGIEISHGKI